MNHNPMQEKEETIYTCPMHPEVKQDKPGMCPECGMNLVKMKNGNLKMENGHAGHKTGSFLKKFWITVALTVPIFFYSEMAMELFGIRGPEFAGWQFALLLLGSVVFFYCGLIFLTSAYRELRAKLPGMMTLIAVAISTAYLYSAYSVFAGNGHDLWFELSSLIAIMLLGHWIEMRAVSGAQGALNELSKLIPDEKVNEGDIVTVKPGGRVPADGVIIDGQSELNESMITGESIPVLRGPGAEVIAGSINGDGAFRMRVTKVGEKTFLAGVMRLVRDAQASKSRLQLLSDRVAYYLTLVALGVGGVTLVVWLLSGAGWPTAVERLVAVLVITCPHALGLAIPLVASISTTMAAKGGFLVRQRSALEMARNITMVFFDKTGTLTEGNFKVTSVSSDEALSLGASVDALSEHPIAKAIVLMAQERKIAFAHGTDYKRLPGVGGEASVGGKKVFVGHRGGADIIVETDGKEIGRITVADVVRQESKEAIADLEKLGVRTAMITGDSEDVAKSVADELGLSKYFARVLPGDKSKIIKEAQSEKKSVVAMVGDGINDAPALTQADIGIAIGAGTNVAIESAGIILVRNDPRDIVKIIRLSRLTYTKMVQNLWWAAGYNIIAIPLAAGVLASKGIVLQPAIAAILMSVSTVVVAINAVLLRRQKL